MSKTQNTPEKRATSFWQKPWVKNLGTVVIFFVIYLALRPFFQGDVIQGQAPQIQLQTLGGQTLDLQAINASGKPVLVHIWATWCPICNFAKDGIEDIAKDYPVISIATQSGSDDSLLDYAAEHGMNPNLIVNDYDGKWMQTFGAKAVPADFIINPNGEIQFVEVGISSQWGLRFRLWIAGLTQPAPVESRP